MNGARKVSGLKRSWNDADDLNGSAAASPTERDMQRSGSGGSNGLKLDGDDLHSPDSSDDRLAKKTRGMPQRGGGATTAMPSMSTNMLMGVGNGSGIHHE